MEHRTATIMRQTKETEIHMTFCLDGTGQSACDTGIGFLDHMLVSFAKHGLFNLAVTCKGDVDVDCHHTVEDVGIVLGEAIKQALNDKRGIKRYGFFLLPMDDALIQCALDLSGRPYYVSDVVYTTQHIGEMDTEMISDFFHAVSVAAGMNLHFMQIYGSNNHHIAEASFKAFAKALDVATSYESRIEDVWSSKGML